ncbi:ferritin-like domain-containing protein [Sphingomonas sp. ac-8]|uniref:ferritin-like domain-containing protein n=1 Tax=Sphingomonas sp. ac-8 TaxID=3242977 RepID=UPI003A805BDD
MTESDTILEALDARVQRRNDRREFFSRALGATALTTAGVAALSRSEPARAQAVTDADILNFALNLEYLEAQFYSYAATGEGLPQAMLGGTGTQGEVRGGRRVAFQDPVVAQYAREIAVDERAHVAFLRNQLGTSAVAQPAVDVSATPTSAFSNAARAAGLIGTGETFDPYANDENFLLGAFIFEDVGVSAYKGAAALITNKAYLEAAAGILAVEAYHAAILRTTLYSKGVETPMLRSSADAISNARDSLDGADDRDQGISPTSGDRPVSNIAPLDADGLAFGRSTGQVLNIVYLNNAAATMGGFFPAGVNGTIRSSAAN